MLGDTLLLVLSSSTLNLNALPVTSPAAICQDPHVGEPAGSSLVAAT